MITLEWIKENGHLVFEAITGSKAYGLNTATSDTDIRGVYILPKELFYSFEYSEQVSNDTNDIVYYELRPFVELLSKNNPNILELLNLPKDCILYEHPVIVEIREELFLSKICEKTFAKYAFTQIKKAYGLKKKIVNPMEEERKLVVDFCYVYTDNQSIPLLHFLKERKFKKEKTGLTAIAHLRDCYNFYYSDESEYAGIVRSDEANDVCLSSIPRVETAVAMLYFDKDGYSVYCKQYKEYWDWVEKRNEER